MSGTFPTLVAAFNNARGSYVPGNLLAGEADLITNRAQARPGMHLAAHTVIAQDSDGYLVAWDSATRATGTLTFSGTGTANDTITIAGRVFTLVAASASDVQVTIGASAAETATNTAEVLNRAVNVAATGVYATVSGAVVTLTAIVGGTGGDSITTTESGTGASFGAATLGGGGATQTSTYGKAIGITAEAVGASDAPADVPYYSGGVFNHEALVWPAATSTLAARRAAFNGTNIEVASLL
jgi:hypothetical protein